jgi:hypothetical protein
MEQVTTDPRSEATSLRNEKPFDESLRYIDLDGSLRAWGASLTFSELYMLIGGAH